MFQIGKGPFMGPTSEFKKLRKMTLLWIVSIHQDGITGYELQDSFNIPQTNAYRLLKTMNQEDLVTLDTRIVDGRAQKRYLITETGKHEFNEMLKEFSGKVGFIFDMMARGNPQEHFKRLIEGRRGMPFFKNRLETTETKEKALELIDKASKFLGRQENMFNLMIKDMARKKSVLRQLKEKIAEMDHYNNQEILKILESLVDT